MSNSILPPHWKSVKLDEICEKISLNGIKIKQKDYLSEGVFPVVDQGQELIGGFYNDGMFVVPNEPPYIVFGDHTKVKKFINFKFIAGADGVKVLKAKENTNPKFLYYSLFTIIIEDRGYARHFQLLEKENFPFPPLSEQHLIVSKIEELFSELDKSVTELKAAKQQLKTYRQSVLKWAFEGRLTNSEFRILNSELAMAAEPQEKYSKQNELPDGWNWVKLGDILESVKNGFGKKPDDEGEKKILRISSVRPNIVELSDVRFLKGDLSSDYEVLENDLLFTRYNGSIDYVGVCGRVPPLKDKIFYPDKLIRCRPIIKDHFHSMYLQFASNSGESRKFILSKLKTTAGQTGIAGSDVKQIPIPLAPIQEQKIIVDEIERRFSVSDKMEESNNILFFTSNGRFGLGGLDIFICPMNGTEYGTVVNAGYPLNTQYDDFAVIVDSKLNQCYFSSNRIDGSGGDDIYSFDLLKGFNIGKKITGFAEKVNGEILPGTFIKLLDDKGNLIDTLTTKENGAFTFLVEADKNFTLIGEKEKYNEGDTVANTFGKEYIVKAVVILTKEEIIVQQTPVTVDLGKVLELKNVYFDLDKYIIRSDAKIELDKIVKTMNENPDMVVELRSYCDCRESKQYNQTLSTKRAEASAQYVKERISKPERIYGKGYGETALVNGCSCEGSEVSECTEAEHQENRRTEFIIVKK